MRIASDSDARPGYRTRSTALWCCAAVLVCVIPAFPRECAAAEVRLVPDVLVQNPGSIQAISEFTPVAAGLRAVGPTWFRRNGIELLRGRDFDDGDRRETPGVVIVNEALAYRLWPGEEAIGKYMLVGLDSPVLRLVVGVVANSRPAECDGTPEAEIYIPCLQAPTAPMLLLA
jgi:hypothetical protein